MPVDPLLEPLLATFAPLPDHIEDWDAYRAQGKAAADAMIDQLTEPGPDVRESRTVQLPVPGGSIDLRIHWPHGSGPHPVHLFLHGGGWVAGSAHDTYVDIVGRERCAGASCVVVAVDYRKAPEHPFPTGLEDAHAALRWVAEQADELGIRRDLITVGGASAGANIAAALALKTRDENGPQLALQLLEAPALDLTLSQPSHERLGTGYGLTLRDIRRLVSLYLDAPDQAMTPYASPLLAEDLSGLPPAHIMSAEYDPLVDDGEQYARRLAEAGVPARFSLQAGQIHHSAALTKVLPAARAWRDEAIDALRAAHRTARPAHVTAIG